MKKLSVMTKSLTMSNFNSMCHNTLSVRIFQIKLEKVTPMSLNFGKFDIEDIAATMATMIEEEDEELETEKINLCFETNDSTFICYVSIEVVVGTDKEQIEELGFDEVINELITSQIEVDKSDTLDAEGKPLFPDTVKARFTLAGGATLEVDDIYFDRELEHADNFTKYIFPALRERVTEGVITQIA